MIILVLAETNNGRFKKSAFEAVHFGYLTAQALDSSCIAVVLGAAENPAVLGEYGASKVIHVSEHTAITDNQKITAVLSAIAQSENAGIVLFNHSSTGKSVAGRVAVSLDADLMSQINGVPKGTIGSYTVTKPVFSGKAIATYQVSNPRSVITVMGNAIPPKQVGSACPVETRSAPSPDTTWQSVEKKTVQGTVPLPEAELVVSAGRGMKGPENWGMIESLADIIGATTACSRPVADTGWRPHHEHVGQTGVAIRPNLYIAIGISGAIQHLAGVNSSKCIVVINKDAEAPFFKAADYGVCGDLFDVVPRLIDSLKKYKSA